MEQEKRLSLNADKSLRRALDIQKAKDLLRKEGFCVANLWHIDDVDYFSVDVDTEEEQYRDFQFKDYDYALKKYKEITYKDTYKGEKLDNVQLVVVFEDGYYETKLMKFYDEYGEFKPKNN